MREDLAKMQEDGWESVEVAEERVELVTCQNKVEFVNIWHMLNFQGVGHVTVNFHVNFFLILPPPSPPTNQPTNLHKCPRHH